MRIYLCNFRSINKYILPEDNTISGLVESDSLLVIKE